jgi:hypothetical protein
MNLTIAIPTIGKRLKEFSALHLYLNKQIVESGLEDSVELIHETDNKEISIGAKRQKFTARAKGKFLWQIDDDDWIVENGIKTINSIIEATECDCIGFIEEISGNGVKQLSHISNIHSGWGDNKTVDGNFYRYVRTPYFKVPILTYYYRKIEISDMRFGEDIDFSNRLKKSRLIKDEFFLPRVIYNYRYKSEPHNEKYGIK